MLEVISDTSPLQYLHQAGHLDLLRLLYGSILIPEGVAAELDAGRKSKVSLPALDDPWLQIVAPSNRRILPLAVDLGRGEREVLSIALERTDCLALLDDGRARAFARHLGIVFTGTLGVLLRAKESGHIEAVRPIVDRLQVLGFRLDDATRSYVLEIAEEL